MKMIKCKLKEIMERRGINAREICYNAKVPENSIYKYMAESQFPKLEYAIRISKFLDLPVEEIWVLCI